MKSRSYSLRLLIVALLTLQLVLTMGLSGWLMLRGSEQVANELLGRLQNDMGKAIETRLQDWLKEPFTALALLARAIERENLDTSQPRNLQALLHDYLDVHSKLTGFGFGSEDNGYVIAMTADRDSAIPVYYAEYADTSTGGDFISYKLEADGSLHDGHLQVRNLDIRQRPWYKLARRMGKPTWSEVYISISRASSDSLALTAAYPLRNADGEWLGVLTGIVNLTRISHLLAGIELDTDARIFIMEADGLLVGSSDGADPVAWRNEQPQRLPAIASADPLIRASAYSMAEQMGGVGAAFHEPLTLGFEGQVYRLISLPLKLDVGIHWQAVLVIPEAMFLGGTSNLLHWNLAVYLGVMLLVALLALHMTRWINRPILNLAQTARAMASGRRSQRLPGSAISELDTMARAFNEMAQRVHELLETLEWRVEKRTLDLREARDAAEAANRAKSTFLANMSHELRTPLTAILGNSELLTRQGLLSDKQRHSVAVINRSGEYLLSLIDEVLDMSRIEAGRLECSPRSVQLHRLLEDVLAMLEAPAARRRLKLSLEYTNDLPDWVYIDGRHLRQVLINLLSNALKFTEHGVVRLHVRRHHWVDQQGWLWFAVADTGCGISADEQGNLFKPFSQTSSGLRSGQGAGLGLALSQRLAELMGGYLRLRSQPGKGSVFLLMLPASLSTPGDAADMQPGTVQLPEALGATSHRLDGQSLALLAEQSDSWRETLMQATMALDHGAIEAMLAELPGTADALNQALRACLHDFDFEAIARALQELQSHG